MKRPKQGMSTISCFLKVKVSSNGKIVAFHEICAQLWLGVFYLGAIKKGPLGSCWATFLLTVSSFPFA
jgi:hypothetical protein